MGLHDAYAAIIVDYQSWKVVAFAMDEAVAVGGDCHVATLLAMTRKGVLAMTWKGVLAMTWMQTACNTHLQRA